MSGEDGGWGGTVDDGWASPALPTGPTSPQPQQGAVPPYPQPPPQPYVPPPQPYAPPQQFAAPAAYGPPGQPAPPRGGMSTKLLGGLVAAAVVIAAVVIAVANSGGSKPHASPTTGSRSSGPASSGSFPSSTPPSGNSSALLSIAPFSGCQQVPSSEFTTSSVTEAIACGGSDVKSGVSADQVDYQKFSSAAALTEWYQHNIITGNQIVSDTGDCSTTTVITTAANAQFCEGSFTDTAGVIARQVLILAPASAVVTDGKSSTATACPNAASYTVLFFTSPSDDVGVSVLACSGTAQLAKSFEQALLAGTLDLND
jgi:hypothetical protein